MELLASRDVDKIDTDLVIFICSSFRENKNKGDMLVYKSEAAGMPPRDVEKIDTNLFINQINY